VPYRNRLSPSTRDTDSGECPKLGIETFATGQSHLQYCSRHSSCLFGLCDIGYRRLYFDIRRITESLHCPSIRTRTVGFTGYWPSSDRK
jgi:hypothetical protein